MKTVHFRNPTNDSSRRCGTRGFVFIPLVLVCFALSPIAQAIVPAPDGGYPGFNTAEGQNALFSLTTGVANTAIGWSSLKSNGEGSFNTATGAGTLLFNTAEENTAFGAAALLFNTTGGENTAVGAAALLNNTEGNENTATGNSALLSNTTGFRNTAAGNGALFTNTIGVQNTANGVDALSGNTSGNNNTAIGYQALYGNTGGVTNTANGTRALFGNTDGNQNTANGYRALEGNITGNANTANGVQALFSNTTGTSNTAVGGAALANNTSGVLNVALGASAGGGVTTADNVICIGALGQNVSNSCYIGQIFGVTSSGGSAVVINSDGKLGTTTSSRRFKEEIKPMDKASEVLFSLKPVTFHYKKEIDPTSRSQFGLVAEEVEKVNPELVVRDKDGKIYSVRYDAVNAMLLNEFLKEHKRVEEQEAKIARLTKQMETIVAHAKEQDSNIQKVSAQVEMSRPVPRVVSHR